MLNSTNDESPTGDTKGNEPTNSSSGDQCHVATVNLPPFCRPDPELWFISVEAQFETARPRITSNNTKLNHILAKIQPEHLRGIADILRDPTKRDYDRIKSAIIKRFGESPEEKLNKLLGPLEIGDKAPSELLRDIQNLAGPDVPSPMIRGIWMRKLPSHTQQILQVSDSEDLNKLAEMADKIQSVHIPAVAAVSSRTPSDIDLLKKQVEVLTEAVNRLVSQSHSRSRSRSNTPFAQRRPSATTDSNRGNLCFYHSKFGNKAVKCLTPCDFNRAEN